MTIHAYTVGEDDGRVVIHRNFEGEHQDSENCWCRPEVIDADSFEPNEDVIEKLEHTDG